MKPKFKLFLFIFFMIIIIVIYIILINFVALFLENYDYSYQLKESVSDGSININVGNSIDFFVKRPRFYGTIYEVDGNKYIYLIDFIRLPISVQGYNFNFFWIHSFFLIFLVLFSIYSISRIFPPEINRQIYKG